MSFEKHGQMKLKRRKRTSAKSEFDENKELNVAIKTGKVLIGGNSVITQISSGVVKLIVLANNAPKNMITTIDALNSTSENPTPVFITHSSSIELGSALGKPYWIAALAILEPGDSSIMKVLEK